MGCVRPTKMRAIFWPDWPCSGRMTSFVWSSSLSARWNCHILFAVQGQSGFPVLANGKSLGFGNLQTLRFCSKLQAYRLIFLSTSLENTFPTIIENFQVNWYWKHSISSFFYLEDVLCHEFASLALSSMAGRFDILVWGSCYYQSLRL